MSGLTELDLIEITRQAQAARSAAIADFFRRAVHAVAARLTLHPTLGAASKG